MIKIVVCLEFIFQVFYLFDFVLFCLLTDHFLVLILQVNSLGLQFSLQANASPVNERPAGKTSQSPHVRRLSFVIFSERGNLNDDLMMSIE